MVIFSKTIEIKSRGIKFWFWINVDFGLIFFQQPSANFFSILYNAAAPQILEFSKWRRFTFSDTHFKRKKLIEFCWFFLLISTNTKLLNLQYDRLYTVNTYCKKLNNYKTKQIFFNSLREFNTNTVSNNVVYATVSWMLQ